jgi:hypothetical protein
MIARAVEVKAATNKRTSVLVGARFYLNSDSNIARMLGRGRGLKLKKREEQEEWKVKDCES